MLLAHGIFSVAHDSDLGLVPTSLSLCRFFGDSRQKGKNKTKQSVRWFCTQPPWGQGGGLVTWLTFKLSPPPKYETLALLGDMHRWMRQLSRSFTQQIFTECLLHAGG